MNEHADWICSTLATYLSKTERPARHGAARSTGSPLHISVCLPSQMKAADDFCRKMQQQSLETGLFQIKAISCYA